MNYAQGGDNSSSTRAQWRMKSLTPVTFGMLFHDDRCANIFEALVGTLRAAKKRKILTYDGELLLQGVHDNAEIVLKPSPVPVAAPAAPAPI
ncbi:hypothetical protein GIB67_008179 [Kingdonia uniflora]|uniref:Costars domain-containing protein n=1 Tax=Kingdonia uniflora TaxID=39325 RepID=A0A7J7LUI8_9MAGN|nr:hypothetical protein GIB67_008179 [Kingdonia uniflora]